MEDSSLHSRLLNAENDLLLGISKGPPALQIFCDAWSHLRRDVEQVVRTHGLEHEIPALAKAVAARIDFLVEAFLDTYRETDVIEVDMMKEFDATFAHFGLTEFCGSVSEPSSLNKRQPNATRDKPNLTSRDVHYQESLDSSMSAYEWLSSNLHNPYPSTTTKSRLAAVSGASVKAVDTWFIRVRQAIGWSTLAQEVFPGSRTQISHVASLALNNGDPATHITEEIRRAFDIIRTNFECLPHQSRCLQEDARKDMPHVTEDLASIRSQLVDGNTLRGEIDLEIERRQVEGGPSDITSDPPFSPSSILDFSSESESDEEEEDTTPPPPVAGCKRRFDSATDTSSDGLEISRDRPVKRSRTDKTNSISSSELPQTHLSHKSPTPIQEPTSLPSSSTHTRHPSQPNVETTERSASPVPFISRKHRLSDADLSRPEPKRPREVLQGPRIHVVSDPLPAGLGDDTLESLLSDGDWAGLFSTNHHTPPNGEPNAAQIVSIDDPTISTNDPCSTLALVPPAQTPSHPAVNLDDPIFSVSDVLALLSASSPDAATATHPTTPSATTALVSENPQATPQGAISTIDWGYFDEITLSQFPTCESIATQGSVTPCPEGLTGYAQSMSLVDDMLLPFMFNPDMNPPPSTFGLDIYSGFGDQSQTWTGLWDLD